jgi:hypothetical protein
MDKIGNSCSLRDEMDDNMAASKSKLSSSFTIPTEKEK